MNFDGFVNYDTLEKNGFFSYVQVFRNAVIEVVDTYTVATVSTEDRFLTPQNYEVGIVQALNLYTSSLVKKIYMVPVLYFFLYSELRNTKYITNLVSYEIEQYQLTEIIYFSRKYILKK